LNCEEERKLVFLVTKLNHFEPESSIKDKEAREEEKNERSREKKGITKEI
jgi:hypothetical protein